MSKYGLKNSHNETDILRNWIIKKDRIGTSLNNLADNILSQVNKKEKTDSKIAKKPLKKS